MSQELLKSINSEIQELENRPKFFQSATKRRTSGADKALLFGLLRNKLKEHKSGENNPKKKTIVKWKGVEIGIDLSSDLKNGHLHQSFIKDLNLSNLNNLAAFNSLCRCNSFQEAVPLINFEQNILQCNSYIEQDQEVFEKISKNTDDENIEVNPMFELRRQRSLINDADDPIVFLQEQILKELEESQNDLDAMLLSEKTSKSDFGQNYLKNVADPHRYADDFGAGDFDGISISQPAEPAASIYLAHNELRNTGAARAPTVAGSPDTNSFVKAKGEPRNSFLTYDKRNSDLSEKQK